MIVQAFNTGAGGGKNFDIYMGAGGEGANTAGCSRQYTTYPTIGQPNNGGIRAQSVSQCVGAMNMYSSTSIATMSCQSAIATDCAMITVKQRVRAKHHPDLLHGEQPGAEPLSPQLERAREAGRVPRQPDPRDRLQTEFQGLPMADPTAVDINSASGNGFSSGYSTTTMQDCCRPTCAYKPNVSGADATYKQYYTCDAAGPRASARDRARTRRALRSRAWRPRAARARRAATKRRLPSAPPRTARSNARPSRSTLTTRPRSCAVATG